MPLSSLMRQIMSQEMHAVPQETLWPSGGAHVHAPLRVAVEPLPTHRHAFAPKPPDRQVLAALRAGQVMPQAQAGPAADGQQPSASPRRAGNHAGVQATFVVARPHHGILCEIHAVHATAQSPCRWAVFQGLHAIGQTAPRCLHVERLLQACAPMPMTRERPTSSIHGLSV